MGREVSRLDEGGLHKVTDRPIDRSKPHVAKKTRSGPRRIAAIRRRFSLGKTLITTGNLAFTGH
jgi:hypothetical protein